MKNLSGKETKGGREAEGGSHPQVAAEIKVSIRQR
jgi:hypothetical protein